MELTKAELNVIILALETATTMLITEIPKADSISADKALKIMQEIIKVKVKVEMIYALHKRII